MAKNIVGSITQVLGAVVDVQFEGSSPVLGWLNFLKRHFSPGVQVVLGHLPIQVLGFYGKRGGVPVYNFEQRVSLQILVPGPHDRA